MYTSHMYIIIISDQNISTNILVIILHIIKQELFNST